MTTRSVSRLVSLIISPRHVWSLKDFKFRPGVNKSHQFVRKGTSQQHISRIYNRVKDITVMRIFLKYTHVNPSINKFQWDTT